MKVLRPLLPLLLIHAVPCHAGVADVVNVSVECVSTCTFAVTVRHEDSGWEHYADRWEVLTPDGKVIATRVLHHPHVDEQPFTRTLSNVKIPQSIDEVSIRAHDSVHNYGGKEIKVVLPPR
jgi:hypothetical protein